ncbi:hypothetical protein [Hanstruepera marina]|uniref:hypothetical protein n=1 Tax=Hanstruepera marina TaxID=2873265 RepID=UPI001CA728A2|nr:hypothetical protein [Hanstruepera marina]
MLKRLHLYGGILIAIIFILTGQYMHHNYDHLKDMELMNRALFRAGHLYILLFGLVNVSLGSYFKISQNQWVKTFQILGSITILLSSVLIIYAFFKELPTESIERPLTRISLYIILFGVSVHGLIALIIKKAS